MKQIKLFSILLSLNLMSNVSFVNAQTPGNLTNLDLWLKADLGVTGTTPISGWSDQSGNAEHATINGDPVFQVVNFNYNPTVNLDGVGDFFSWGDFVDGKTAGDVFTVHKLPTATPSITREIWDWGSFGSGSSHHYVNDEFYDDFGVGGPFGGNVLQIGNGHTAYADVTKQFIYNTSGGAGGRQNYIQGIMTDSKPTMYPLGDTVTIGVGDFEFGSQPLIADFGEIIFFDRKLTLIERRKVWTYLGVKYGITLEDIGGGANGDYIATNNSLIWDASENSAYHNSIIGIGRDDDETLLQKQSHTLDDTTRIYLDTLQTSNIINAGAFSNDISYIVMGHNNDLLYNVALPAAEIPIGLINCALYSRLEREWKITKTNVTENFNWDQKISLGGVPTSVNPADLRLLIDDDGDFSNGGTVCYYNGDGSGVVISYSNPTITVANISAAMIPNNSTRYMTIASINATTPLPIELTQFDVDCQDETPILTWTTASELNNDYFTLEESRDGLFFETIATVQGAGTSTAQHQYSWTDGTSFPGVKYYRLSQTDFDGTTEQFGSRSVNCGLSQNVTISPNPFENQFTLNAKYDGSLTLFDNTGKIVLEQLFNAGNNAIQTHNIASGYYAAVMLLQNGDRVILKLIKL